MTGPQTGGLPIDLAGPGYDFGHRAAVLTDPAAANMRQPHGAYSWSGVHETDLLRDPASGRAFAVMKQMAVEGTMISTRPFRRSMISPASSESDIL